MGFPLNEPERRARVDQVTSPSASYSSPAEYLADNAKRVRLVAKFVATTGPQLMSVSTSKDAAREALEFLARPPYPILPRADGAAFSDRESSRINRCVVPVLAAALVHHQGTVQVPVDALRRFPQIIEQVERLDKDFAGALRSQLGPGKLPVWNAVTLREEAQAIKSEARSAGRTKVAAPAVLCGIPVKEDPAFEAHLWMALGDLASSSPTADEPTNTFLQESQVPALANAVAAGPEAVINRLATVESVMILKTIMERFPDVLAQTEPSAKRFIETAVVNQTEGSLRPPMEPLLA